MNSTVYYFKTLARRNIFPTCCLGILIFLGGASWILAHENRTLSAKQRIRQEQGEAVLSALVQEQSLRQELAAARATNRRIQDNLVSESNLAENLWYFYKIEEQTKSHIEDLRPLVVSGGEGSALYKKASFTVRVTGGAPQVADFVQSLETGPRLTNITAFTMRRRNPGNSAIVATLTLDMLGGK